MHEVADPVQDEHDVEHEVQTEEEAKVPAGQVVTQAAPLRLPEAHDRHALLPDPEHVEQGDEQARQVVPEV